MTIGDFFKTNSTDFIGKPAFDTFKFKQRGGDTAHPPYRDVIHGKDKHNMSCKVTRVYINASWFTDWLGWKKQADAALNAVIGGKREYYGDTVRTSEGYPISTEPRYLIEDGLDPFGKPDISVWINAACPDEAAFAETVAEAKSLIAQRQELYRRNGSIPATLDAERPHYDVLTNRTAGTVGELFN